MTFFVVVRGALGVGKSTISKALARAIEGRVVSIDEILDLWEWDGGSEELFLKANEVAANTARTQLIRGVPVVFDGNFYWERQVEDLLARLPFPHEVFTLKAPLAVCIERDSHRLPSHGPGGAREVFEKVARLEFGIPIDATRDIALVTKEIGSLLPRG